MMKGTGADESFDLTGTTIESSKAVGVISFHENAAVFQDMVDFQQTGDAMGEMLSPVNQWGKEHVAVQPYLPDEGVLYRMLACQDNTSYTVKWFDITGKLIGSEEGVLNDGEYFQKTIGSVDHSPYSVSVWVSDKPTAVYSLSGLGESPGSGHVSEHLTRIAPVEQAPGADNVLLFPVERFTGLVKVFQTVVVLGDSTDMDHTLLKQVEIGNTNGNSRPLHLNSLLLYNRIPGTNYYVARFEWEEGDAELRNGTFIAANAYRIGPSQVYSLLNGTFDLNSVDTTPPEIDIVSLPGRVEVIASDDGSPDVSGGIQYFDVTEFYSDNHDYEGPAYLYQGGDRLTTASIVANQEEINKNVLIRAVAVDFAGNRTIVNDTIEKEELAYPEFFIEDTDIVFPETLLGQRDTLWKRIENLGSVGFMVDSIVFDPPVYFRSMQGAFGVAHHNSQNFGIEFTSSWNGAFTTTATMSVYTNIQVEPYEINISAHMAPFVANPPQYWVRYNENGGKNNELPLTIGSEDVTIDSLLFTYTNLEYIEPHLPALLFGSTEAVLEWRLFREPEEPPFELSIGVKSSIDGIVYPGTIDVVVPIATIAGSVPSVPISYTSSYPSPNSNLVSFDLPRVVRPLVEVEVFTYGGELVMQSREELVAGKVELQHNLKAGLYVVKLCSGDVVYLSTMVVIK